MACCFTACHQKGQPIEPYQKENERILSGWYPTVSPNGSHIAYVRRDTVFIADRNGENKTQIYEGYIVPQSMRWRFDNNTIGFIAYDSLGGVNNAIVFIDLQTGVKTVFPISVDARYNNWSWNSTATELACWTRDDNSTRQYLTITNNQGTIINKYNAYEYDWSPDGKEIAYLSNQNISTDSSRLYIAASDTVQQIVASDQILFSLEWTPDQNIIAFNQLGRGLFLYDISQKTAVDSFDIIGYYPNNLSYQVSPDGKHIAYIYTEFNYNPDGPPYETLYSISIDTHVSELIVPKYAGFISYDWFPSSDELIYGFNGNTFNGDIYVTTIE